MKTDNNIIGFVAELSQSETAGQNYAGFFNVEKNPPVLSYLITDLHRYFLNILLKVDGLTMFQIGTLEKIFLAFIEIQQVIDPNRLSSFEYSFTCDNELVLFRNTEYSLTNIIIDSDEVFALSIIPKNPDNQKSLEFYDADYHDFEGLAYRFFS